MSKTTITYYSPAVELPSAQVFKLLREPNVRIVIDPANTHQAILKNVYDRCVITLEQLKYLLNSGLIKKVPTSDNAESEYNLTQAGIAFAATQLIPRYGDAPVVFYVVINGVRARTIESATGDMLAALVYALNLGGASVTIEVAAAKAPPRSEKFLAAIDYACDASGWPLNFTESDHA